MYQIKIEYESKCGHWQIYLYDWTVYSNNGHLTCLCTLTLLGNLFKTV